MGNKQTKNKNKKDKNNKDKSIIKETNEIIKKDIYKYNIVFVGEFNMELKQV